MIPLWVLFALISSLAGGMVAVLIRYVLKDHDWASYTSVTHILAGLLFLPLVFLNPVFPSNPYAWKIMILSVIIWTVAIVISYKSFQIIEVSDRSPLTQTRVLIVLAIAVLFLSETLTMNKIFGTLLIFAGALLITFNKHKPFARFSEKGVQLTLIATLLIALASIVDKVAMNYWVPEVYGFFLFLVPGIIITSVTLKRKHEFFRLMKKHTSTVIFASFLYVILYLFRLKAFALTEISNVFPILRLSTMFAVGGGIVLLKERKHVMRKVVSAVLMIIGALFISGYLVI